VQKGSNDEEFIAQKMIEIFCGIRLSDVANIKLTSLNEMVAHFTNLFSQKPEFTQTFKIGDIAAWKRTEQDWIFCEIVAISKADGTVKIKVFKNMKFSIKTLKNKSYLHKLSRNEIDEHENSINYLIALSILELNSKKTYADKLLMKEIHSGLIDGLVADQGRPRAYTDTGASITGGVVAEHSHYLSAMAPGTMSDESSEETTSSGGCCSRFRRRICCRNST
jgi:hypothetical protein